MKKSPLHRPLTLFTIATLAFLAIQVACARQAGSGPATTATAALTPEPADVWFSVLQRTPYPYTTPLPALVRTDIDSTYSKFDASEAEHVPCKRCPDWLPEGGIWRLNLDRGVYRVFHEETGWRSLGSFTVSGDRIWLFNDPNCPEVTGVYTWKLRDGILSFSAIEDECSVGLRAANLTRQPWLTCHAPTSEGAVSDHWPKPPDCRYGLPADRMDTRPVRLTGKGDES